MDGSTDTGGEELLWVRVGRSSRNFELRAGESVLARLEWSDRNRANGFWAERHYQFRRKSGCASASCSMTVRPQRQAGRWPHS